MNILKVQTICNCCCRPTVTTTGTQTAAVRAATASRKHPQHGRGIADTEGRLSRAIFDECAVADVCSHMPLAVLHSNCRGYADRAMLQVDTKLSCVCPVDGSVRERTLLHWNFG